MKLVGLMVARNEAWCLRASIPAALQWCDALVILDHASTDKTLSIAMDFFERDRKIHLLCDDDPKWREAELRQRLLDKGRAIGGTHFAIIDADEILTVHGMHRIGADIAAMRHGELWKLPWITCWRSPTEYRCDDSPFGHARCKTLFCDNNNTGGNNTGGNNYAIDSDGYQTHKRIPEGLSVSEPYSQEDGIGVLHLQHAVWRRVMAKQRLYAVVEKRDFGAVRANYRGTIDETGLQTKPVPREWWPVDPNLLNLNAEIWQQAELERLAKEGLSPPF